MKGTLTAENNAMLAQANKQAALTSSLKLGKGHSRVASIAPSFRAAAAPVVTPSVATAAPVVTPPGPTAANINVSHIPNNESPENALARLTAEVEAENADNNNE